MKSDQMNKIVDDLTEILELARNKEEFLTLNSDELSSMEVRLASLKATFGEIVTEAEIISRETAAYVELRKSQEWLTARKESKENKLGYTGGDLEAIVQTKIVDDNKKMFEAQRRYKILKTRLDSLSEVINAIKDRLKVLRDERFDGGSHRIEGR